MLKVSIRFHNALMQGKVPITYCMIETHLTNRVYSDRELQGIFAAAGLLADGSVIADGSEVAGAESTGVLEKSGRVLNFGNFSRTIEPQSSDLLAAWSGKQKQHISVSLDNADNYMTKLIAKEPFLSRKLSIFAGFDDHPQSDHYPIFKGTITEIGVETNSMTLEASES